MSCRKGLEQHCPQDLHRGRLRGRDAAGLFAAQRVCELPPLIVGLASELLKLHSPCIALLPLPPVHDPVAGLAPEEAMQDATQLT